MDDRDARDGGIYVINPRLNHHVTLEGITPGGIFLSTTGQENEQGRDEAYKNYATDDPTSDGW